jgi:hypothetical protein
VLIGPAGIFTVETKTISKLYPGWFVRSAGPNPSVWVLEPKALPAFLESEEETLSAADIKLVTFHLSRFIRTSR